MIALVNKFLREPVFFCTVLSATCVALGDVLSGTAGVVVGSVVGVALLGTARQLVVPTTKLDNGE